VATTEKNKRAAMTALMGAGMFGLVPHPMACLEPYRRESRLLAEDDLPLLHGVRDATTREQIAQPSRKLESTGLGGGVQ
jgi:hypothetical protein